MLKVIWDVQTGHRRLCPAPENSKAGCGFNMFQAAQIGVQLKLLTIRKNQDQNKSNKPNLGCFTTHFWVPHFFFQFFVVNTFQLGCFKRGPSADRWSPKSRPRPPRRRPAARRCRRRGWGRQGTTSAWRQAGGPSVWTFLLGVFVG